MVSDAESCARALRNCQQLYGHDAITIGADVRLLFDAVWLTVRSDLPVRKLIDIRDPLVGDPPDPNDVMESPPIRVALDTLTRLQPVLGAAPALPSCSRTPACFRSNCSGVTLEAGRRMS